MRATIPLLLALTSTAFADDGLRCGTRLVSAGESEASVAAKCGAPTDATRHVESMCDDDGAVCVRVIVDLWTYDRGATEFVRILRFENAFLRTVFVGNYGH